MLRGIMEHLTPKLALLTVVISCVFAFVPKSNMKCECTCSPTNSPYKKYLAVGNFEASFKPKTETVINAEEIPSVPLELLDSPFRKMDSFTKQDKKSLENKTIKESESNKKKLPISGTLPIPPVPPVPPVQSYSSNPIIESTMSPSAGTVKPESAVDIDGTPSAFRKAERMILKESKEPTINKIPKILKDSRKINELTKSEVITLDDIIFGKVPYDFGSRGIQRSFLTETEAQDTRTIKPSELDSSKLLVNKTTSAKTTITETTASKTPKSTSSVPETTASKTPKSTSSVPETTASETTVLETTPLETTTVEKVPVSTSSPTETSSSTTQTTITTTVAPTTTQTTTKGKSSQGLLPLFRTAYSQKAKKSEKTKTTIAPSNPSTKPELKTVTTTTKTTTPAPATTTTTITRKLTKTTRAPTTTRTTVRPTTRTTQKPSTKRQPTAPKKATYNVPLPTFDKSAQNNGKSIKSQNQVNPSYSFSDSFKRNTIKNLLDAFKPNYMEKDQYTVTPNPRPKQAEVVQPYRPPAGPSRMQLPGGDIQFGRFDERIAPVQTVPSYQVRSLGSPSSMNGMNGQQIAKSPGQNFAVMNQPNPSQQVVYQDRVQSSPERMSWNPVQEAKKWGEPVQEAKKWGEPVQEANKWGEPVQEANKWGEPVQEANKWGEPKNWAISQQQQQQQQQLTWNSQNQQSWNSQQQQQRIAEPKKPTFLSPGFAVAGNTPQVQQQMNPPFPGLQVPPKSQSPIDFRVH